MSAATKSPSVRFSGDSHGLTAFVGGTAVATLSSGKGWTVSSELVSGFFGSMGKAKAAVVKAYGS